MRGRAPAPTPSPEQADERLLIEAAQKDPARFAELYELHFETVYAFVARRVGNREAAEDVTSEVFHKALANLRRFEWRGAPFAAWLLRIASNTLADRSKKAGKELYFEDPPEIVSNVAMEQAIHLGHIFRLVDDLPADQRRVVIMRFAEEKSIQQIAAQMERSEGAIKQLQLRGLQNLRLRLDSAASGSRRTSRESRKSGGKNG